MTLASRIYRLFLRFYPAGFRDEYESPMERQFRDEYQEAGSAGKRLVLWLNTLYDLAATVPVELLRELASDLKLAFRIYRKRFISTTLAVVALGLAIGVSTGVFSVLNALLFRSLPFSDPSQLVELVQPAASAFSGRTAFNKWASNNAYLQSAVTFDTSDMNLAGEQGALRVKVTESSANLFQLLGVKPVEGRAFTPDEDVTGRNSVAVISYGVWQQSFAGDPNVAGKTLRVNGAPLTIVGVAPPGFDYPSKTAIWIPTVFDFETLPKHGAFLFQTIGRLKAGMSLRAAQAFYAAEVRRANGSQAPVVNTEDPTQPHLVTLQSQLAGPAQRASWVLAGLALLVLLTACANVAQLLLSRATERQQELAVRAALGASRSRLLKQLTTEASLLTCMGGLLGLFVAYWCAALASSIAPAQLATQAYTLLDWRVLLFAVSIPLLMGLVLGILPSWALRRRRSCAELVRNQPGNQDLAARKLRLSLLAVQAALAVCLITSSLTVGRTFLQLIGANLGFSPAGVVTLNVSLDGTRYQNAREWEYYSQALRQLRSVSGLKAAGAVNYLPLANNLYMAFRFKLDSGQSLQRIVVNSVTPGYFEAMETRFLAGRDFIEDASNKPQPEVVVNDAFARQTGLGNRIVGRKLIAPWSQVPYSIIGVVTTARDAGPASTGAPEIYWFMKAEPPRAVTLVARVDGSAESFLPRCRDAVKMLDPSVPVYDVKTLNERLDEVLARPKFYTTATLFLTLLSVLLAAVGTFGTTAYSVAQRRHELGIRMAIGATHGRIRSMIIRENLLPMLIGIVSGAALSLAAGGFLRHLMENTASTSSLASLAATVMLFFIGLVSAWSATAKVLSVDPSEAIRAE